MHVHVKTVRANVIFVLEVMLYHSSCDITFEKGFYNSGANVIYLKDGFNRENYLTEYMFSKIFYEHIVQDYLY